MVLKYSKLETVELCGLYWHVLLVFVYMCESDISQTQDLKADGL